MDKGQREGQAKVNRERREGMGGRGE